MQRAILGPHSVVCSDLLYITEIVLHDMLYDITEIVLNCSVSLCSVLALHSVPCTKRIKKVWFRTGTGTHLKRHEICVSECEHVRMTCKA